ncbi:TRAP transporter large permease [Pelagibacterium xiamenense]|uniref:TRAP transporter large permease n=1 Tax=Pelagibacterium xiamenense TaxID=2901140 RepID=UPI001E5C1E82|nr:TRAP transporter large permease [Pelagibacterium xiamenense]MCD7058630.1 TRAP transporter large permease [Pelagibacterium xiamenense]
MLVILVFGSLLGLITFTRLPLGFVMLLTGGAGIAVLHPRGIPAGIAVAEQQIMDLALNYNFSVLPLFILMGVFVVKAGLAEELFEAARRWLGHYRGGLGLATVAACGGFSAMTASSAASTATMARLAIPEMDKYKYDQGFSSGTVAAGGTLGILIPPSGALIIYALLIEGSVAELFIAGVLPGILTALLYLLVVAAVARLAPQWAPSGPRFDWGARFSALWKIWVVLALFGIIMVGLVLGWFSPTEAGGIGAGGAFIFALVRRKLTWAIFVDALAEAAKLSTMIFIVAAGALVLNQFINLSGVTGDAVDFIQSLGLEPWQVIACLIIFYFLLGCMMDGFAMIFLTVPIIAPLVADLGYDLVWWGIVTVMVVEISLITPPIGMNVFLLKAMQPNLPVTEIYKGIFPYLAADFVRLALVLFIPAIALWLPSLMHG